MAAFRVWHHTIPEGVSLEPLDRFVGRDGSLIQASQVGLIEIRIFDVKGGALLYELTNLTAGNGSTGPIFNTLQTDGRWTRSELPLDRRGYNFRRLVTLAQIEAFSGAKLKSGSVYRLEIIVHTTPWEDLVSVHEYTIERVFSVAS